MTHTHTKKTQEQLKCVGLLNIPQVLVKWTWYICNTLPYTSLVLIYNMAMSSWGSQAVRGLINPAIKDSSLPWWMSLRPPLLKFPKGSGLIANTTLAWDIALRRHGSSAIRLLMKLRRTASLGNCRSLRDWMAAIQWLQSFRWYMRYSPRW